MTDLSTETDLAACRARQRRLIEVMERLDVDLAIVTQTEHVQYLAGPRFRPSFSPAAALSRDGRLTLVAPADFRDPAAADEVVPFAGPVAVHVAQRSACGVDGRAVGSVGARGQGAGGSASSIPVADCTSRRVATRSGSTSSPICIASAAAKTPTNWPG